eukprot:scaffold20205_cov57-Cyclotella_meneghiniana.AAC.2
MSGRCPRPSVYILRGRVSARRLKLWIYDSLTRPKHKTQPNAIYGTPSSRSPTRSMTMNEHIHTINIILHAFRHNRLINS